MVGSRNFADPLAAIRAIGRCEAKDAIPTGTRRRRWILPPFWSYSSVAMSLQRIRVCAAVQVSPILRIPPRNSCNLMQASFTTRTRRAPAASRWHSSHTGMNQPCAQKYPSKLAHSDGNRESGRSLATRAQSGLCRPILVDKLPKRCRPAHTAGTRACVRTRTHANAKPPLNPQIIRAQIQVHRESFLRRAHTRLL